MRTLVLAATLFFLALAWLHPAATSFDGMAFLRGAREGWSDPGHALYTPLLGAFVRACDGVLEAVAAARLLSALGALATFVLLARHVERHGLPRLEAVLVAFLFAGAPLLWQEAGSIEPTTWTVASLLVARWAAERHAAQPGALRLAAVLLAFALALGFHLAALVALPWIVGGAWPARRGARAWLVAAGAATLLAVALLAFRSAPLERFAGYWTGVLLELESGVSELGAHARRGALLLVQGAPVLLLVGLGAVLHAPRVAGRAAGLLGLPFLVVFLLFGKPLVGLLVPCLLALALVLAAVGPAVPRFRRALVAACALQLAFTLFHALGWRKEVDAARREAELLAAHLPAGVPLVAGGLANHLRYFHPELEVLSLPEAWYRARAADRSADPIEVAWAEVRATGRRCALSSDGVAFLHSIGADVTRLGLQRGDALRIEADPRLALFPIGP